MPLKMGIVKSMISSWTPLKEPYDSIIPIRTLYRVFSLE